jgi:hypothetical protein
MLPQMYKKTSLFEPFKMLVAHKPCADYSITSEVPVPLRYGFETQLIITNHGQAQLGKYNESRPAVKIKVMSDEFGNNALAPATLRRPDEFQIYSDNLADMELLPTMKVGDAFARAGGEDLDGMTTAEIAQDLCNLINDRDFNMIASIDPLDDTQVIVQSVSLFDNLIIQFMQFSYDLFNGSPPFLVYDLDDNLLFDPTIEHKLGRKEVVREKSILPMEELKESPVANDFSNFIKSIKFIPTYVHTNIKTADQTVRFVAPSGNSVEMVYNPLTKNTITYNLVGGVYVKTEVPVDNLTITSLGAPQADAMRVVGSLDKNKQTIIDLIAPF